MNKKLIIILGGIFTTLLGIFIVVMISGVLKGPITYQEVSTNIPEKISLTLRNLSVNSTGISEIGSDTYIIIMPGYGEDVKIISVDRVGVSIDVKYHTIITSDSKKPLPKIIKFKGYGSPVAFQLIK
jgi:hypothetical protein